MRRFDVEDLPPDRWARIERDVFERLEDEQSLAQSPSARREAPPAGSPRRAIVTFVLAGAAAAVLGAVAWEHLRPATHGTEPGVSRVSTDDAATHLQVGENVIDVGAHSTVTIQGDDAAGIEVALDHGDVDCEVAPRKGRPPFVVSAGDVRVLVVGTHFRVARNGHVTRVAVTHGTVEVDDAAGSRLVHSGESWPATTPSAPDGVDAPMTNPSGSPSTPQPAVGHAARPNEPSARARYEKALELESSHPDIALSTYRELAAGSDAWAMNALFAEARLEMERGHVKDAQRLASEYLTRFPNGPNARDASELRTRLE